MTYIAQKSNPFILNMNLNELNKYKMDLLNKEKDSEYISSITSKYKNEIISLKSYIEKMNVFIRNNLNLDNFPSYEEGFSSISKKIYNGEQNSEDLQDLINEWMNRIINVDYINPLITLYENYIKNLENELKNCKETNKKYENQINKLIKENNDLRNKILINEEELKNFLEVRNDSGDSSSMIIMDRDYMMRLEEKNQLLSRENEILMINLNKLQNDYMQLRSNIGPKIIESNDDKYIQLNNENLQLKNNNKKLIGQLNLGEQKIKEISDRNNSLENENQNLKDVLEKNNFELNTLRTSKKIVKEFLNQEKNDQ